MVENILDGLRLLLPNDDDEDEEEEEQPVFLSILSFFKAQILVSSVQQTPIWGQLNPIQSAKDK